MNELFKEVPEAEKFCNEIIKNIDKYKLYPGECFKQYTIGVISTSSIDLHGDRVTPKALYSMEKQINERGIWQCVEHNPLIQPIGRSIATKVFYAPKSNIYFLAFVGGHYDIKKISSFKDLGIDLNEITDEELDVSASTEGYQAKIAFNPHEIKSSIIQGILDGCPTIVDKKPEITFRKAADPITIIKVVSAVWLLTSNPFSKKFLERFGEKTADEVIKFFEWLRKKVIMQVSKLKNKKVLFEFDVPHKGCRIEFVIASKEINKLNKAVDTVNSAVKRAIKLVDRIQHLEIETLVYEFDLNNEQWYPLHAATRKKGVISERPVLVALERYKGMSISGVVISFVINKREKPNIS